MDDASVWNGNWAWSLPLIVITVIFHVIGLVFINERVVRARRFLKGGRSFLVTFALILGLATLFAILLHAAEAAWMGCRRDPNSCKTTPVSTPACQDSNLATCSSTSASTLGTSALSIPRPSTA